MKIIFVKTVILVSLIFFYFNSLKAQTVTSASSYPVTTVAQVSNENGFQEMTAFPNKEPALTPEQKNLLEEGLKWVDQNLKCIQKGKPPSTWSTSPNGNCFEVWNVLFGNFSYPGMVLDVSGDSQLAAHGTMLADEKFIFCTFANGDFSAKVFEKKDGESNLRLVNFGRGVDLVWIGDRVDLMGSEGPSKAHVYQEVHGVMKEVLTYEYSEREEGVEYPDELETRLIPQENRGIFLIKMTTQNNLDSQGNNQPVTTVTETYYKWNSSVENYTTDIAEKTIPNDIWKK